jgi:hypothetical protein
MEQAAHDGRESQSGILPNLSRVRCILTNMTVRPSG